jgi:hypothetical protein
MNEQYRNYQLKEANLLAEYGVIYLERTGRVRQVPFATNTLLGDFQAGLSALGLTYATHIGPHWNLPFKARISWEERWYHGNKVFDIKTALKSRDTTTEELYGLLAGPVREICELKGYNRIYTTTGLPKRHMEKLGWRALFDKNLLGFNRYFLDVENLRRT